ncbi:MAG: hypothetical protein ABEI11_03410 [Haloarculaceae archaeon]
MTRDAGSDEGGGRARVGDDRERPDGGMAAREHDRGGHDATAGAVPAAVDGAIARFAAACDAVAYRWVQASFAFVFLYFGLQKWPVVRGASPVRPPVQAFVEAVGFGGWIPLAPEVGLLLIGIYEATLGVLWVATLVEERWLGTSRAFLGAAPMTLAHQSITFLPLVVVPEVAFRGTQLWLPLVGTGPLPVALDWLSAFILKNLLFLGAFFYAFAEWAERYGPAPGRATAGG